MLKAFRDCGDEAEALFARINEEFASVLPRWNLWRILKPTLDAAGVGLHEVAYLNAVPYRTRGDAMPKAHARDAAWRLVTGPTLDALRPGLLVALGKKAGDIMARLHRGEARTECVPRTIGDSYVSDDAPAMLEQIAAGRAWLHPMTRAALRSGNAASTWTNLRVGRDGVMPRRHRVNNRGPSGAADSLRPPDAAFEYTVRMSCGLAISHCLREWRRRSRSPARVGHRVGHLWPDALRAAAASVAAHLNN